METERSIRHEEMLDKLTRAHIASNYNRQKAVAQFPMRVISMAVDLDKLLSLKEQLDAPDELLNSTIDCIEGRICEEFRRLFGREMLQR